MAPVLAPVCPSFPGGGGAEEGLPFLGTDQRKETGLPHCIAYLTFHTRHLFLTLSDPLQLLANK